MFRRKDIEEWLNNGLKIRRSYLTILKTSGRVQRVIEGTRGVHGGGLGLREWHKGDYEGIDGETGGGEGGDRGEDRGEDRGDEIEDKEE